MMIKNKFFSLFCGMVLCTSLFSCSGKHSKNLIILIGDGMGSNHIAAGERITGRQYPFKELDHYKSETESLLLSGDLTCTDSAASATAIATGTLTLKGMVGIDTDENELPTILDYGIKKGKKVGIVTTDICSGATSAGFSAHSIDRSATTDIFNTQLDSGVNIFVSASSSFYSEKTKVINEHGYEYVTSLDDLSQSKNYFVQPGLGDVEAKVDLKDAVKSTLYYLNNDNGFVVMIEEAYIDKYSHNKDFINMTTAMNRFEKTVEFCLDFAKKDGNTAVIITADHETGSLEVEDYDVASHNYQKGNIKFSYDFTSRDHSIELVDVYCYNANVRQEQFKYFGFGNKQYKNSELYSLFIDTLG